MSSKRRNKKRKIMEKRNVTGGNMIEQTTEKAKEQNSPGTMEAPAVETSAAEIPAQGALAAEAPVTEIPSQETPVSETSVPEMPVHSELPVTSIKRVEKNLYLQYNNLEFSDRLMFEAAINDYCQNTGVSAEDIEVVNLYVKPEEGKAYYVINQDSEKAGFIDL